MRTLLLIGLLTACPSSMAPSVREGPRGPRASDHYAAAREQDELARERLTVPPEPRFEPGAQEMRVRPYQSRSTAAELERLATTHRAQAAALEEEYEEACGGVPFGKASSSPFRRYAIGSLNTDTGVMLYLRAGIQPEELQTEIRCHRAWLMIAPSTSSDDSALDLPDLQLDVKRVTEGLSVSVTVDARLLPELRRRLARDLEAYRSVARAE